MESTYAQEASPVSMSNVADYVKIAISKALEQLMVNRKYSVYSKFVFEHLLSPNSTFIYICSLLILVCFLVKTYRHDGSFSYLAMCVLFITVMGVSMVRIGIVTEVLSGLDPIKPRDGIHGLPSPLNLYPLHIIAIELLILVIAQYFLIAQNYRGRTIPVVIAEIAFCIFMAVGAYLVFLGWRTSFPLASSDDIKRLMSNFFIFIPIMFVATCFLTLLASVLDMACDMAGIVDGIDDIARLVHNPQAPNTEYRLLSLKFLGCI